MIKKKWRKELDSLLKNLNQTKEQIEKDKKDCKKYNDNPGNTSLTCNYNNCNKVCLSKAGLANHIHQSHSKKSSENQMLFLSQRLQATRHLQSPKKMWKRTEEPDFSFCNYLMVDERRSSKRVCVLLRWFSAPASQWTNEQRKKCACVCSI